MQFRPERVGKLIREELARIILEEINFNGALVTLTGVVVDKKLDNAAVNVSVIPSDRAPRALEILHRATPRLQHLLWKKINIKPMPQISFAIDRGSENAAAVEKVFEENRDREEFEGKRDM